MNGLRCGPGQLSPAVAGGPRDFPLDTTSALRHFFDQHML
jgi:hypothetical protein